MDAAVKIGKRTIRLVNGIVSLFVLIVILLLLVFGCYAIWDSDQVYASAASARYTIYKPTAENQGLSFKELQAVNPEVFSWLTVYGTHIDYPVVRGGDNLKYINTDAKGKYSLSGAIFLDAESSLGYTDFNSIFYGHHMDKNAMFGEIGLFADQSYFNAHEYGKLYYNGLEQGLQFFAFIHTDAYNSSVFHTNITGKANQQAYLSLLARLAVHTRAGVDVTANDRIVLLSTCSASSTNGRDILIGKIIGEVPADTFITKQTDKPNPIPVISSLPGLWVGASLPAKLILSALPLLLILLAIVLIHTKRKHARQTRNQ